MEKHQCDICINAPSCCNGHMSCALNHVIARDHITLYGHLVEHPLFKVFQTF